MSLFDSILGNVMSSIKVGNASGGDHPLLQVAMKMLQGDGQGGNGLEQIVGAFKQGGLGNLADSWVGTGENLPVSGEQISEVLGSGKIGEIASQLGLSTSDVSSGLSQLLPSLIDKVTPNGQIPATGELLQNALSMFLKR